MELSSGATIFMSLPLFNNRCVATGARLSDRPICVVLVTADEEVLALVIIEAAAVLGDSISEIECPKRVDSLAG